MDNGDFEHLCRLKERIKERWNGNCHKSNLCSARIDNQPEISNNNRRGVLCPTHLGSLLEATVLPRIPRMNLNIFLLLPKLYTRKLTLLLMLSRRWPISRIWEQTGTLWWYSSMLGRNDFIFPVAFTVPLDPSRRSRRLWECS